jgi:acyl-CoA thioesterase FadM
MEVVLETVVRCTEIDVNGHVNNARYVEYWEWGREEWYEAHSFSYARLLALGAITGVVSLNLNLRQLCHPGDWLRIVTRLEPPPPARLPSGGTFGRNASATFVAWHRRVV